MATSQLDQFLRLRLADLPAKTFEDFFLHFFNAGITLTIERHGSRLSRKIISAETYAPGGGKDQHGIDLRLVVEGPEEWCVQCKRQKSWNRSQTVAAIEKAKQYQAHHYFLAVACDPGAEVHEEMKRHPDWSFWNLDRICEEFRLRVPTTSQPKCLFFLEPGETKRFVPCSTEALVAPDEFFSPFLGSERLFRHDWTLVGREDELRVLGDFVRVPEQKVLVLSSKGGDGKSRLLWAFTHDFNDRFPGAQALFLNPHSRDEPAFAFLGESPTRIVVIDDAHRLEQVPTALLSLVRDNPGAKVILATRPQALAALNERLLEVGLPTPPPLSLKRLKRSELEELAAEALGQDLRPHAPALADLTADCPFLTVLAGDLLRQDSLRWGCWASDSAFSGRVLRAFETENLRSFEAPEQNTARGLLRIVALLSPTITTPDLIEGGSWCLETSAFLVETLIHRLRATELLIQQDETLRIAPELFADFLVYDVCYDPGSKMPDFVRRVLSKFQTSAPAALRNLAEATWVARASGLDGDRLIRPLFASQMLQFEQESFVNRAQVLRHWKAFSVFLPQESLALARQAIALTSAPIKHPLSEWNDLGERLDTHRAVLTELPAVLRPIALYHDDYRAAALDLLWQLGRPSEPTGATHNHAWSAIAEVVELTPEKPIAVSLDVLNWFSSLLHGPEATRILTGGTPGLRVLLGPCFARVVEFSRREGRTFRWGTLAVDLESTRPVRAKALAILREIIDRGATPALLDALSALEVAIDRILPADAPQDDQRDQLRRLWRPQRLEALQLYQHALSRPLPVAPRFAIRQKLRRLLAYDEDADFKAECRRLLDSIPQDLELQIASVLLSHGFFEVDDPAATPARRHEESASRWELQVQDAASALLRTHPEPEHLLTFLNALAGELKLAEHHPDFAPLFGELVKSSPRVAAQLAERIVESGVEGRLATALPALVDQNIALADRAGMALLTRAARGSRPDAAAAVVGFIRWRSSRNSAGMSAEESELVVELASRKDPDVAHRLLELCRDAPDTAASTTSRILDRLPLAELPARLSAMAFEVLVPYRKPQKPRPLDLVSRVFQKLVPVPKLELHHQWQQFHELCGTAPREVYELLHARVLRATGETAPKGYAPFPEGYHCSLRIPELAKVPDFQAICADLWQRVLDADPSRAWHWRRLWRAAVLPEASAWRPRLLQEVHAAQSPEALSNLADLVLFDGSLVVFRYPELTRNLLERAQRVGGPVGLAEMRSQLRIGTGPAVRGYEDGVLESSDDYLEAEAFKASERHATDPWLGPFYRWIVEVEQRNRRSHKARFEAEMAAWD